MKLLSCYIENYGALSQKNIDFQENLTVFCEDNGYGKTTLVSFLKAMFYGLPSYKTSSKGLPERQHFYPFNGGKFGGNLTFSHEGKTYRVERFFDKKSDTKDICRIFCDTFETQDFGKNGESLGRTLFKLDEDSFTRTVFVENLAEEFSMTTDIGVSLNRLVDDADEDRNFERALKVLTDKRKALHTDRGHRGLIPETQTTVRRLEERIDRFRNVQQKELESCYEKKKEAHRACEECTVALKQAFERTYWKIYDDKTKELAEMESELDTLHREYPHGFPTQEERKELYVSLDSLAKCLSVSKETPSDVQKKRLSELSSLFVNGVPTDADLVGADNRIREAESLTVEIDTIRQGMEADRVLSVTSHFQKKIPSESELSQMRDTAKRYHENQTLLQARTEKQSAPFHSRKMLFSAFGGAVLALIGLLCFFLFVPLGTVLTAIGVASFALFVAFYIRGKKKAEEELLAFRKERAKLQQTVDSLRASLLSFLSAFDYPIENNIDLAFMRFQSDLESYRAFCERQETSARKAEEKNARLLEVQKEVQAFFGKYDLDCANDRHSLTALRDNVQEYARLLAEQRSLEQKKQESDQSAKTLLASINKIFTAYGITLAQATLTREFIDGLMRSAEREKSLRESIRTLADRAEELKKEYKLESRPDVTDENPIDVYQNALKEAQTRESEVESRIRELEFELEELPELENALSHAQEELAQYQQAHRTISQTAEFLQKAEQNLKDRYVMPVCNIFCRYATEMESTLSEKISMDKDFRISFDRGGELRSDKHLSAGQYAISSLCMRLALAEQIYGEELPFLILDDPFVYLDETHLQKALRTVSLLAEKTQILYFTCHASRAQFEGKESILS